MPLVPALCRSLAFSLTLALVAGSALAQGICDGVAPVEYTGLKTVTVANGLTQPLYIVSPPGDNDRIFIVEQPGTVRIHKRGQPPGALSTFLEITTIVDNSGNEAGLLSLAFDPDYETNGFFYVFYTETAGLFTLRTVVARYSLSADPDVADPGSEVRLMTINQPQFETNHNGGLLLFGPDDMLYIFVGDGGGSNDNHGACGNGQNNASLLGKVLRIDPTGATGGPPECGGVGNYTVPAGNPFVGEAGCDEIYSFGLRNPWRASFDEGDCDIGTGQCALYIADVGQQCLEEINYVSGESNGGENYGWRQMEGTHFFRPSQSGNCDPGPACENCSGYPESCTDTSALLRPIHEYPNAGSNDCSVTGGYVYRGCLMPNLKGAYFFGDYCSGEVSSFKVVAGAKTEFTDWPSLDLGVTNALTSFGLNGRREIFQAVRTGEVRKILPLFTDLRVSAPGSSAPFLLQTGPDLWSWQDLFFDTEHPVDSYRVYRGAPGGLFDCVFTTPDPEWVGGDPTVPLSGELLAYLVTAVSAAEETSPGEGTNGDPRQLSTAPCP